MQDENKFHHCQGEVFVPLSLFQRAIQTGAGRSRLVEQQNIERRWRKPYIRRLIEIVVAEVSDRGADSFSPSEAFAWVRNRADFLRLHSDRPEAKWHGDFDTALRRESQKSRARVNRVGRGRYVVR